MGRRGFILRDASEPSNEEHIETDLCIVGAGPVGISIARKLRGNGYQICLLESGGRHPERRAQQLNRCQSTGYPIQLYIARACVRVHIPGGGDPTRPGPLVPWIRETSRHDSGWPFDRAHLSPFYERAHTANELGPFDYDPGNWTTACTPELPLAGGETGSGFRSPA